MSIENDLIALNKLLKLHQKSTTRARTEVFKVLWRQPPLSMKELESRLEGRIDRASIYRAIELFIQLRIAEKIYQGWKYRIELSEKFHPHHHHMRCNRCGSTYDFNEPDSMGDIINTITKKYGFEASSHQFEIDGVCKHCQA